MSYDIEELAKDLKNGFLSGKQIHTRKYDLPPAPTPQALRHPTKEHVRRGPITKRPKSTPFSRLPNHGRVIVLRAQRMHISPRDYWLRARAYQRQIAKG